MGLALGGGEVGGKESLTCALFRNATGHGNQLDECLVAENRGIRRLF